MELFFASVLQRFPTILTNVDDIAMIGTKCVVNLINDCRQRIAIIAKPYANRVESVAQYPWKTEHLDFRTTQNDTMAFQNSVTPDFEVTAVSGAVIFEME